MGEWGGESDYLISRRLKGQLEAKYGEIKYEEGPTSFTAYAIAYDRPLRRLSLYMTQKCIEAAYEYLPQLQQGVRPSAQLKKGETLERLADALRLPPPGTSDAPSSAQRSIESRRSSAASNISRGRALTSRCRFTG